MFLAGRGDSPCYEDILYKIVEILTKFLINKNFGEILEMFSLEVLSVSFYSVLFTTVR